MVRSDGFVGLETITPSKRLQVAGSVTLNNEISTSGLNNRDFVNDGNASGWYTYNYGMTLGWRNVGTGMDRYRTLLFSPSTADIAFATHVGGTAPTGQSSFSERLTIQGSTGNVGVGVTNPQHKLHLEGNAHINGVLTGTEIRATYQDVAEWVPASTNLEAGTVVVLDPSLGNGVRASDAPYDTTVAGVISAQPGILLGEAGHDKEQVATTGRVRAKVDASFAPIRVGDLLVTSARPGDAMRSMPVELNGISLHRPGTIVGKALQALGNGEGEILVLLSLQ